MSTVTEIHNITFKPYPKGDGPAFNVRTWYGGVAIDPSGQSKVKLGYCVSMDGEPVFGSRVGSEDYFTSPDKPFESNDTLAFLMGYLTNDFLIGDLIEGASGLGRQQLERYKLHLGPLWDYVVDLYGEDACYGI